MPHPLVARLRCVSVSPTTTTTTRTIATDDLDVAVAPERLLWRRHRLRRPPESQAHRLRRHRPPESFLRRHRPSSSWSSSSRIFVVQSLALATLASSSSAAAPVALATLASSSATRTASSRISRTAPLLESARNFVWSTATSASDRPYDCDCGYAYHGAKLNYISNS